MKKFCLLGAVDKRLVAYPLIKVLMLLGKVLVVSDDGVYRRFGESFEDSFSLGNSDFVVVHRVTEDLMSVLGSKEHEYDFVLYITTNDLPSNCDKVIYARGKDRAVVSDPVLISLENQDFTEVYITFSRLEDNSLVKLEPNKSVLSYIYDCEDKREFLSLKDQSIATMLHKFFEVNLDLPRNTIKGLLAREG